MGPPRGEKGPFAPPPVSTDGFELGGIYERLTGEKALADISANRLQTAKRKSRFIDRRRYGVLKPDAEGYLLWNDLLLDLNKQQEQYKFSGGWLIAALRV